MYSSSGKNVRLCCFCIPLRLGVFLSAAFTIIISLVMIYSKHQFEDALRVFGGGYVIQSRVLISFIEVTGCVWGVIGMLGTWENRCSYVKIYNYYQMVRLGAWVLMYFTDFPPLMQCEMWATDINKALKEQGWNPVMYRIAFSGQCYNERALFILCSTLGFIFFAYLTYMNQLYQDLLDEEPNYVLRVSKNTSSNGAFFAQSVGEDTRLLKQDQKFVGAPVKYDPTL